MGVRNRRRVYAAPARRLAGRRDLSPDHAEELLDRIDAERSGRRLVLELTALPEADRAVFAAAPGPAP